MTNPEKILYTWNGDFALAYQFLGEGPSLAVSLPLGNAPTGTGRSPSTLGSCGNWRGRSGAHGRSPTSCARSGSRSRAGLHAGECEIAGKLGGLTVSLGARVAAKAGPSEVLVSQTDRDLVAGSGGVFEDVGEHELKGVPGPWRLYRVVDG